MHLNVLWFAPLPMALLADALGFHEGLDVSYDRTRSSDQQFEQLLDGSVDVVVTAMDNVIEWNRRAPDCSFRIVAQVEKTTELTVFGRPGLSDIRELQGGRLLVDAPYNGFAVALYALLTASGIDIDACEKIPAGGVTERLDALLAGTGDATLLGPPFDQAALEAGCKILARVNDSWPHFPGQGLVIANSRRAELAPALECWLHALNQSLALAATAPQDAITVLGKAGLPPQIATRATTAIPPDLRPDGAGGELLIEHRRMIGFPGGDLAFADLIDLSLLSKRSH